MEQVTSFELNAKLQQKKNLVRKELAKKGILKRGAENEFDKYKYFSESQYKQLFTELFSNNGLELTTSIVEVFEFSGTQKMPFGRRVEMSIKLTDIETGFGETSITVGEGTDKGDKAIYKAMTGALKYYFADNFIVATGDDPETESGDGVPLMITKIHADTIKSVYKDKLPQLLEARGLAKIEDMPYEDGAKLVEELIAKRKATV